MKAGAAFPGAYIKAAELGRSKPVVTIKGVRMEDIGDDHKPVLYFEGKEKGLVLNKTNANAITGITGTDEMDDWAGHQIQLYSTKVQFQAQMVDAIRVQVPDVPRPAVVPKPPPPPADPGPDDDVPF